MSKFLIILSVLVFSSMNLTMAQDHIGFDLPGDRPQRPQQPDRPNRPDRPGQRVVFHKVDSYRVQKFIETTHTSRINSPNVKLISFTALENSIEIVEARLLLENGREIYLDGMTGGLRTNNTVNYSLNSRYGERVRSITVTAVARNLIGSRPTLQISVGI